MIILWIKNLKKSMTPLDKKMNLKIEHHHHHPLVFIWIKTTQLFQSHEYTQIFIMTIQWNWNLRISIYKYLKWKKASYWENTLNQKKRVLQATMNILNIENQLSACIHICVYIVAPRWNMIRNQPNCKQNLCHVVYPPLHH